MNASARQSATLPSERGRSCPREPQSRNPRTKLSTLLLALVFTCSIPLWAQLTNTNSVEFRSVAVFLVSTNAPLAAYQLQFNVISDGAKIVGIEGGEHPAFAGPPFYDPEAMQHERVILAAFSTNSAPQLPAGRTRMATVHLQVRRGEELKFTTKLDAAADANGNKLTVGIVIEENSAQ